MTRKHYRLIADAINDCTNGVVCIDKTIFIDAMINIFMDDNSAFDRQRFINRIEFNSNYKHSLNGEQLKKISAIMNECNNGDM